MKNEIYEVIREAVAKAGYDVPAFFDVSEPPRREMGDFASNVAMMISQQQPELSPRESADNISIELKNNEIIESVEVAGPGFINLKVKTDYYLKELRSILADGENYGKGSSEKGKKVNVEYVSANPTGPLHIGNARGGPLGEAISNLYAFLGFEVTKEFYVNDIGGQIDRLAESFLYWYEVKHDERVNFPEGGYPGDYVQEISNQVQRENEEKLASLVNREELLQFFKKEGLAILIRQLKEDLTLIGIEYDKWSYQSDIEFSGKTDRVVSELIEKGATIKREGALWFKNPADPELADRESVLKKSDEKSTLTYFADDIAYHKDKFERGANLAIDIWGANHHGHIPRMRAALSALGFSPEDFQVVLYQYVRLKNAGEVMRMAKREGNIITLRQVIESGVAPDAFKYFILAQNPNTPFDFDIELAKDTSEKNPVYYIKYAHARIASILRKAKEFGIEIEEGREAELLGQADLSLLKSNKEQDLYKALTQFPELVQEIGRNFQIQALPHFAYKISALFHDYYTDHPVLSEDKNLTLARLCLVFATKQVIFNCLRILDIEAPEKM